MMKNLNKFLVFALMTTILFVGFVNAVVPASTKVQVIIQNNTIQIKGDNIIDFSDTFLVSYTGESNCSNFTGNLINFNYSINYIKDVELVFVAETLNESGLSCLNELGKANDKWTQCYTDNMDISIANALCQQDRGYKDNYTTCQTNLANTNAQISSKDTLIQTKQTEIDTEKSNTYQKYGIGVLVGVVACYLYLRRKGETSPARFGGENFPQNPSNLA